MHYLPKKSEAQKYFDSIIDNLKTVKIKSVFSLCSASWSSNRGNFRTYDSDDSIFILFENDMCLIIYYRFIDCLEAEFRKLTVEELNRYNDLLIKDYFNGSQDIYDFKMNKITGTETIKLNYSYIERITIKSVTEEYEKRIGNGLDFVSPTPETFSEITFIMANKKSFTICAGDAMTDGYMLLWAEDAECNSKNIIYKIWASDCFIFPKPFHPYFISFNSSISHVTSSVNVEKSMSRSTLP